MKFYAYMRLKRTEKHLIDEGQKLSFEYVHINI